MKREDKLRILTLLEHRAQLKDIHNSCPYCLICHRKLTNPKSIERRMGNVCYSKFNKGYRGIQAKI